MSSQIKKYHSAAIAYFFYGLVYFSGAIVLLNAGLSDRGGPAFYIIGLFFLLGVPALLWHGHKRRSFKILASLILLFMIVRIFEVLKIAVSNSEMVSLPWGGEIAISIGAVIFALVTITAACFVGRAIFSKPW